VAGQSPEKPMMAASFASTAWMVALTVVVFVMLAVSVTRCRRRRRDSNDILDIDADSKSVVSTVSL